MVGKRAGRNVPKFENRANSDPTLPGFGNEVSGFENFQDYNQINYIRFLLWFYSVNSIILSILIQTNGAGKRAGRNVPKFENRANSDPTLPGQLIRGLRE